MGHAGHHEARRAVLIAGPTASGKSALALELAEICRGTVINADSMQVYSDLRIITARPSPADEARVPHMLYGHVDAAENYSVGRWIEDARAALAAAAADGRMPIVVGGTGLYFKALLQGLTAVPPIPAEIRAAIRSRLAEEGAPALHAALAARDPAAADRIKPADRVRIARALEVIESTGRPLADWHQDALPPLLDAAGVEAVFLMPERKELHRRIEARFDTMLADGALDEVRALAGRDLDPLLPAMKAHGVPWIRRYLAGTMTLAEAADMAKQDTRRYTKRQLTWFRHQLGDWPWLAPDAARAALMQGVAR